MYYCGRDISSEKLLDLYNEYMIVYKNSPVCDIREYIYWDCCDYHRKLGYAHLLLSILAYKFNETNNIKSDG